MPQTWACRSPINLRVETASASLAVCFIAANTDLLAFLDAAALLVHADVHRGFLAAGTDIFQLFDIIGQRQQIGRAGERFALEIGAQAVADDGHALHLRQLVQLLRELAKYKFRSY